MNTTPIDRLRATHIEERDDLGPYCARDATTYPCDTIAALDALEDPRPRLPWRCTGCGAKADEVQWAAIDSIYYDGHTVGISEPDLCGPFRMPGDETEPLREENKQLQARIDAATEQAEALVVALERILDEGPICFPEDKERCHCCEGTEEHGHSESCHWVLGRATLRAYRDWLTVGSPEAQQTEKAP